MNAFLKNLICWTKSTLTISKHWCACFFPFLKQRETKICCNKLPRRNASLSRLLKRLKRRSRIEKEAVRGLETIFANHFRLFCTRLSMGVDDALLWFTWDKQVVSKLHCCKIFVSKYSYLHFGNLMAAFRDLKEILFSTNRNLLAEDLELFEIKYFINREKLNFNGKLPNNLE